MVLVDRFRRRTLYSCTSACLSRVRTPSPGVRRAHLHTAPCVSSAFEETFEWRALAGQGVQGSVTLQVRLKPQQWWGWGGGFLMGPARVAEDAVSVPSGGGAGKALYTMTATMEGGEYDFTLSSDAFSLEGQYGDVEILATVTEWATGETQNGTASVSVSSSSYMVELTGAPFFQPGLPYHISAQVRPWPLPTLPLLTQQPLANTTARHLGAVPPLVPCSLPLFEIRSATCSTTNYCFLAWRGRKRPFASSDLRKAACSGAQ